MTGHTTNYIRAEFGYTQKELSAKYGIPLPTIKNWDARGCMPEYLFRLIVDVECYERNAGVAIVL